jgi:hypothetical protein
VTTKLKLAKDLTLPVDVVTQTVAVLAKRRAGKSYTMRRLVEQLYQAGQQVVLVDPKGDQWGIRSAADGKGPGLPFVILGGERADVPLEVGAGEIVAKLVVEERVSVVLDLSLFRKHEVATFMTAFMENLYRLKAKEIYRTPVMLVIDEADAVAPQKPQKGEERMLGAAEDIVRRGGQRGIGCVLVTQRSAVLNKNVLTQTQILIVLRTIAPQDLLAMKAWVDVHGTDDEAAKLMDSLPSLPVGDAWVWSPGWPTTDGIFQRVHVLPIETFDSGATPKSGEKRIEPKHAADVDLDALKRQMAATIEKAKADDPKLLKAEVAKLRGALEKASREKPVTPTKTVEKAVLSDTDRTLLKKYTAALTHGIEAVKATRKAAAEELVKDIEAGIRYYLLSIEGAGDRAFTQIEKILDGKNFQKILDKLSAVPAQPQPFAGRRADLPARASARSRVVSSTGTSTNNERPGRSVSAASGNSSDLGKGERRTLTAIAQHQDGVTREQLTVLTGYTRSSRNTYIQRLGAAGFVEVGDRIRATDAGVAALGDVEALPTGSALADYWMRELPAGERTVLAALIAAYPKAVDRERLSELTSYTRSSRNTYLQRLGARELVTSDRDGVRASQELFD